MIEVYTKSLTSRSYMDKRYFEFKPKGKMLWLQRLCFWVLRKLHCEAMLPRDKADRVRIDPESVSKSILKQQSDIIRHGYAKHGELEVFVGYDQINELRLTNNNFFTFGGFDNIDITVVDWMDGVLVVPKRRMRVGR